MNCQRKQISDLPLEIKEYLLNMLDGVSLLRMRCVSSEWKIILDEPNMALLKKWKQVCFTEMDDNSIRSVLRNLNPKYFLSTKHEPWCTIYKNWHQWRSLPRWAFRKSKLIGILDCEVTCIANSGEWIIIGTRNYGSIMALRYMTKDIEWLYKGANILHIDPYAVNSNSYALLQGLAHDKLSVQFENLRRGELDLRTLTIEFIQELPGKRQCFYFEDKKLEIDIPSDTSSIIMVSKLGEEEVKQIEIPFIWSIEHCWKDRNYLLTTQGGYYIIVDDNLNEINNHPFNRLQLNGGKRHPEFMIRYFFGDSVMISVNKNHYFKHKMTIVIAGGIGVYMPFMEASFHITSVVYYGMVLYLGTDTGNINAYRTKCLQDLLRLDLCNPCTIFELGTDPIISITLRETTGKPILWASSHTHIFQIMFRTARKPK